MFRGVAIAIGILVLAAALVFVAKGYVLFQLTLILCYTVALVGLNLLTGYNGQISLGHGAFFAVGAYAMAALVEKAGWTYWASLPVAAIVCFVAGYVFGRPALKLQGVYLALATFTLGVVTPQLLKYKHLEAVTGGSAALS
jgi:branched-chain amino acid transport system permease protein